jgi:iron complex outermembrane recepter protein
MDPAILLDLDSRAVIVMLRVFLSALLVVGVSALGSSQTPSASKTNQDITSLGIEDLLKIDVFDSFKTPMPLRKVPAAVYIVTQDDIRRSGAINLAEALRLVPGVEVARIGVIYYSITLRGFGGELSNKVLVLLDGRTLYSPYQNAVYWEVEDVVMENIDRIEVIRGPGGSLWGANAANGVINIVTKSSKRTQGGLVTHEVGDLERNQTQVQYGGKLSGGGTYRAYAQYELTHASDYDVSGTSANDASSMKNAGFRADWDLHNGSFMLQGSIDNKDIGEYQFVPLVTAPYSETTMLNDYVRSTNLLGKWDTNWLDGAHSSVQAYYNFLSYPYTNEGSTAHTYDLAFDHRFADLGRHSVTVGGGYRLMDNGTYPGPTAVLIPGHSTETIFGGFAQDDVTLSKKDILTLGLKVEHNDYTGYEWEPNVRFSHSPNDTQTFWASVGRNVRTPSQVEESVFSLTQVNPPANGQSLPTASAVLGNPGLTAESLIANEIGYRAKLNDRASVDVSTYYNIYDQLIYLAPGAPFESSVFGAPILVTPSYYENGDHGQSYGLEFSGKYRFGPTLRSEIGLTYEQRSSFAYGTELAIPHYQASLHLAWEPAKKLELDGTLHWNDAIFDQQVPAYTKLDIHLGWNLSDRFNLSVGGYDLFTPRHLEFGALSSDYIARSYRVELRYRF